jgi:8-oxo-dGTP pyrophosphatase MutT (NUDIX family)
MNINALIKCAELFHFAATEYWGKKASGILFVCAEDNTMLLLRRSNLVEQPGTWSIAGGAIGEGYHVNVHGEKDPPNKVFLSSAQREAEEELGSLPLVDRLIDTTMFTDGSFTYKTYVFNISLKEKLLWTPSIKLNWENDEAKWFAIDNAPGNLHFGLEYSLNQLRRQSTEQPAVEENPGIQEPSEDL